MNSNTTGPVSAIETLERITLGIVTIEYATGVILNLFTATVILKNPKLNSPANQLLLSLAFGDTLFGCNFIFTLGGLLSNIAGDDSANRIFCKFQQFLLMCGIFINFSSIVCIACERAYSLHFPLRSRLYITKGRVRIICMVYWITAIIWSLVDQSFSLQQADNENKLCWMGGIYVYKILNIITLVVFFSMSSLVFVLYISIGCLLYCRSHRSKGNNTNESNRNANYQKGKLQNVEINNIETLDKRVQKKESQGHGMKELHGHNMKGHGIKVSLERKTITVLVSCMLVYYILYLPAEVTLFLDLGVIWKHIAYIMLAGNSFINPCMYWRHPIFNEAYRKALGLKSRMVQQFSSTVSETVSST